jgi:YfiR/HmsC-like
MLNTAGARIRARLRKKVRLHAQRLLWVGLFGLLLLFCLPCPAAGQEFAKVSPRKVEAAFLRNFTHYVTWPSHAFANDHSPWHVCILGSDPFGETLEQTFEGRTEQGRSFEIFRAETPAELPRCQIVFVAYKISTNRRAALTELQNRPVLTVGDAAGFLQEGGIIRFDVTDHVEISVNLDQARSASLTIQTKMLEVSHEVVRNGDVWRRK